MTKTYARINKETLEFICSQVGISISFLSQKTGNKEARVISWLDKTSNDFPTITQAKGIAKALKVPFAGLYMSKDKLPIKKLPLVRNLRTLPHALPIDDSSLNLGIFELIRYNEFVTSSETELNISTVPLSLPIISERASVSDYAKVIRAFYDIKNEDQFKLASARQFYLYIRQKIESKGIFIHCFTGVDVDIARGISIYNETEPIIGINNNDRYPAKTFSIIHELVHILKRQSTLCNEMVSSFSSSNEEVFCNAVAGEVLVPATSLNAYIDARKIDEINFGVIETTANSFCVSKEVVIRRLLDTHRFSKIEYDIFANEIHQKFLQEREEKKIARQEGRGQKIPRNVSRDAVDKNSPKVCRVLLIGYSDGYFSKQEVSGFLGIREKHIPKFLAEVAKW